MFPPANSHKMCMYGCSMSFSRLGLFTATQARGNQPSPGWTANPGVLKNIYRSMAVPLSNSWPHKDIRRLRLSPCLGGFGRQRIECYFEDSCVLFWLIFSLPAHGLSSRPEFHAFERSVYDPVLEQLCDLVGVSQCGGHFVGSQPRHEEFLEHMSAV